MKKIGFIASIIALLLVTVSYPLCAQSPEESFRKSFPGRPFDAITPSPIPGVYELVVGTDVFYYAPGPELLIGGPIITKEGRNLTNDRRPAVIGEKMKSLPLDQAVKIGKGPKTVIEITDPDCPYCRKASEFFKKRTDVTRYVFFLPLAMHPEAEGKIRYVFCAKDKEAAYEEAMSGRLDGKKPALCADPAVDKLVAAHKDVAAKAGVNGTPFFYINGQSVFGANTPVIERLLDEKK